MVVLSCWPIDTGHLKRNYHALIFSMETCSTLCLVLDDPVLISLETFCY